MKKSVMLLCLLATLGVAACGADESREDADDVGNGQVDKSTPNVAAFNNRYSNVEHKCLYDKGAHGPQTEGTGLRIIVTTDKKVAVIPDPHCPGFRPEQAGTVAVGGNSP